MKYETLKEKLLSKIYADIEKADKLDLGSDQHSKAVEDICRLCKAYEDDFKVENEIDNQTRKIENDKIRDAAEIRIKQQQAEIEFTKQRRIKPDTIFNAMVITGLTVGCCVFESKGHIFPAKMLKFADKIKFAV